MIYVQLHVGGAHLSSNRNIHLEGLRGLAAFVVLFAHCIAAFFPTAFGSTNNVAKVLTFLYNGQAAVVIFFVLSGFVLTRQYFLSWNTDVIYRNAFKRYPRLMGPALLAILTSYFLFRFNLYFYEDAAIITKSNWLYHFGYAYQKIFTPNCSDALLQGIYLTFVRGDSFYNVSLWTMHYELVGSFLIFGLALIVALNKNKYAFFSFLFLAVSVCIFNSPYYIAFLLGFTLARYLPVGYNIHPFLKIIMTITALYFLNYIGENVYFYKWMHSLFGEQKEYMHIFAGGILIIIFYSFHNVAPDKNLYKIYKFIGDLSFPLYIIHIPILCSIGCFVFLIVDKTSPISAPYIAFLVSVCVSFFVALPLIRFNKWWLNRVNLITTFVQKAR